MTGGQDDASEAILTAGDDVPLQDFDSDKAEDLIAAKITLRNVEAEIRKLQDEKTKLWIEMSRHGNKIVGLENTVGTIWKIGGALAGIALSASLTAAGTVLWSLLTK